MQIVVNGLISGAGIALLATAFQAAYLPTKVFFFGLAGIYAACPFIAFALRRAGYGWEIAIPASIFSSVVICLLCEWVNHAPLNRRQAPQSAHLISSLGISIVLVQIIALLWGHEARSLRNGPDSITRLGPVFVAGAQWVTLATAMGLLSVFGLLLMKSSIGIRLRALADNPTQFALLGYNVDYYRLLAFCICGVFTAAASLVTAYDSGFDPHGGLHATLLAVVAVIIGGQKSFLGPVVGGLLIGIMRTVVVWHFSARWQEAATFALLAVFLLFRPRGILGNDVRLESSN